MTFLYLYMEIMYTTVYSLTSQNLSFNLSIEMFKEMKDNNNKLFINCSPGKRGADSSKWIPRLPPV